MLMKLAKDNGKNQQNQNRNDRDRNYPIRSHPITISTASPCQNLQREGKKKVHTYEPYPSVS